MNIVESVRQNLNWAWAVLAGIVIVVALIVLPLTSALVVVGGVLFAIMLLRWHEIGLYIAILAVPFGSWFPVQVSVGNLTAADLFVALLISLWLVRMIVQERGIVIRFPPLSVPFALFLGAALLSVAGALSLQHAVKEFIKWLEMFAMYLYVANNLDLAKATRALAVMFAAGVSEAAIGIYQFLFRVGPEGFSLFGQFMRAYGTFEQPNPYAGYLALIIPVALGAVWGLMSQVSSSKLVEPKTLSLKLAALSWAFVCAVALIAMLTAVVMSWSRGAWFGVAAGSIVTVIVQSRRAFVLTVIAAFVLTFIILLSSINIIPETVAARFSGITDYFGLTLSPTLESQAGETQPIGESVRFVFDVRGVKVDDTNYAIVERMAHWQSAAMMFAEHPVFGVGIGNYAPVYPAYALPHWGDPLGHAHNYYLNVAAETGLIGLTAYLILWSAALWQGWRAVRLSSGMWRSIAAGLLGVIVALSVHNTFDDLFVHGMAVQVGIGLGMIALINNDKSQMHE